MGGGRLLVLGKRRRWWFGRREVRRARGGEGGGYVGLSVLYNIYMNSLPCGGFSGRGGEEGEGGGLL